jgi:choline dehydrogenase-like flavoprotein
VAARLSLGLPSSKILVIEAGPAAPNELGINIPGRKGTLLGTTYDWNFTTIPQPNANNRTIGVNRGKVLGGSSALNLLCWDRAASCEYDSWGEVVGSRAWSWRSMIAAMIKAETFTGKNTETYGSAGVGDYGPVKSVVNRFIPAHQLAWIPAGVAVGMPTNKESLGGNPIGVMYQPSSIDSTIWNRSYSANAYLPIAGSNLKVLTNAKVVKINFKKFAQLQRAISITLENGTEITASKEVILSAGAIQSPNLLELSGIGQASVLSAAGITQLIDLPGVGENYQDHIRIQSSYQLKDNYTSFDTLKNSTIAAQELAKWLAGEFSWYDYTASGYLFANWKQFVSNESQLLGLAEAAIGSSRHPSDRKKLGFMSNPTVPQLEIIFSDGYTGVKGYPAVGTPLNGKSFFTLIAGLMHPLSRGSCHINPADKLGKPIINPNYLNNEHDIQALVESIKFCRRIAQTEPLKSVWVSEYEPGLDVVKTDAEWRKYVLGNTLSIFHPTSTCSMLPKKDGGVVDASLTVYGTTNLRVVDASIFPVQISAHIQTAVYGVAEIASDMIIAVAHKRDSRQ